MTKFASLIAVAASAAVVAAIWRGTAEHTNDGDKVPPAHASVTTAASPSITYPASDFIEQEKGRAGGVLKVSVAGDVPTLDFHITPSGNWLHRFLWDNLVYLDDKGDVTPWLATAWDVSPDGKIYTFRLRQDVTFSDGTKFNAEAVQVNLDRIRDPASKSAAGASYLGPYVGGKVIDEYTFEAHLSEPFSPFLAQLANMCFGMMSPKAIREAPEKLAENPIATGPFVVESYRRQQSFTFVKRKDYNWAPPFIRHDGPAYLDRIEVQIISEPLVRYSSLVSGQTDVTLDAPPQSARELRANPQFIMANRVVPGNTVRGPIFNVQKPPFDDLRVRRAFAYAVDREAITRLVGFGELYAADTFLASNVAYYDASLRGLLRYDVAEANRILDEAGWTERDAKGYRQKNGQRLSAEVIMTESSAGGAGATDLVVVAIQSDVKKIGFDLKIVQLPSGQRQQIRSSGNYQAIGPGGYYSGNTPATLYLVYHSSQIVTEKYIGQNTTRLHDSALDDLLQRARQSSDPVQLKDLYSQVQKKLIELVPTVPLYNFQALSAYHKDIKGLIFDTSVNRPTFTTAWIDRTEP